MIAAETVHLSATARRLLTVAAALVVTALGLWALDRLLLDVKWSEVSASFHAIPPRVVVGALACTALSYLALTFYDYLALRIIGKPMKWRVAALASFSSYTLSHNLGLAVLTGGSARMRIYGAAGLRAGDVARVIASAGFAFWGGVFMLASMALAVQPAHMETGLLSLPPASQRTIGVALCITGATLILALGRTPRDLNLFGWRLTLPNRRQASMQIGLAAVDLAFASMALFILAPDAPITLYPAFFLAYAVAIIIALLSHVPGGVGVFEAVMLAMLPTVGKEGLLTALIAYRLIYYVLPLIIALLMIAAHEGAAWRKPLGRTWGFAETIARHAAPPMLSIFVAAGGMVLLASGSLPALPGRFRDISRIVPMPFVEASHLAASIIGAILILLASGLYRRLDGAFWLTRLLLVAGAGFSLLKGLDFEEALVLLLIAALLQSCRAAFYRKTSLTSAILTPGWIATLCVAVGVSIWIGLVAYRHIDYQSDLWWQFGRHQDASRFLRAVLAAGVVTIGAAVWMLLRPAGRKVIDQDDVAAPDAAMVLARRTDALLALTGDKLFLVSPSRRAFLMYQVQGHSWIMMGDPVGDPDDWPDLLWRLRERADAAQGRLLLYQITLETLPLAVDLGLTIVKYGEEARIDLGGFTLDGPQARALRHALRRAEREGATFEIIAADRVPAILPDLRAVSDGWLAAKGATEKSFSVGRFDDAYISRLDCAVVRCEDRIIAFANIWATVDGKELSVDLMRHSADAPPGVMDFIFTKLLLWGQARGYRWFTLGLAPLSGMEARRLSPLWVKAASFLYRHGDAFYGFGGLRAYKAKFAPVWEPRFIAGPQGLSLARAMVDLQRLIGGRGSAARKTRQAAGAVGQ